MAVWNLKSNRSIHSTQTGSYPVGNGLAPEVEIQVKSPMFSTAKTGALQTTPARSYLASLHATKTPRPIIATPDVNRWVRLGVLQGCGPAAAPIKELLITLKTRFRNQLYNIRDRDLHPRGSRFDGKDYAKPIVGGSSELPNSGLRKHLLA
jgi:hypothetical protein